MISVVTLTYKRHHLLEEAIQSFLLQGREDCEMLIVNDAIDVSYHIPNHDNVRIINTGYRFDCILDKLFFGFSKAKYNYLYRLDDDDLLSKDALNKATQAISDNPNYDVYRSHKHHYFENNQYIKTVGNVNNGNIYTKDYISRVPSKFMSIAEDLYLTFENNASIYTMDYTTMIYRWGMGTYHISGIGNHDTDVVYSTVDRLTYENGDILLNPHFEEDYYDKVKNEY